MEIDKDYIAYLKEAGKTDELLIIYSDIIIDLLQRIDEKLSAGVENPLNTNLMGQYKIQPQGYLRHKPTS